MKKLIITVLFFIFTSLILPVLADILPLSTKSIKHYGVGVLNMPKSYTVYQYPYTDSKILREVNYENIKRSAIVNTVDIRRVSYVAYVPSNNVALLAVDLNPGNDWYNVFLNQETGETGWVYNPDKKAFMTYRTLFYRYGKKYGLRFFNDLSEEEKVLYAKEDLESKVLTQVNYPKFVTFAVIRGNWMLASINDNAKQTKIGWFKWRNDDGTLNMFPHLSERRK